MYRVNRWLPASLLALHILLKLIAQENSIFVDLILYNLIWVAAIASIIQAPLSNDPIAIATGALSIGFWGVGSLINSYGDFYSLPESSRLVAQLSYVLFYPLLMIAIPRTLSRGRRLNPIELLDSIIFALGISAIATALFLSKVFPDSFVDTRDQFFALLFPVSDLLLLTFAAIALVTHRLHLRAALLFLGIIAFSATDLFFLWLTVNNRYVFGEVTDDGWLLGITLIATCFWHSQNAGEIDMTIHPVFIALSIFISPTLLALSALRPGLFSIYILIPTITTLFLAFIRMTIVIRQARNLGEERVLARTDELTGLPNRRRLVAELAMYSKTEGALLLLDLDNFKPVNDQFGHEFGDQILQQVSQRFSRSLPTGAVLARLGGDEFGVLINGSYETTLEAAYALQATLSYPFLVRGKTISIGVSIGHAQNDGTSNLLEKADAAMYEAKRSKVGVIQASQVYQP
jgi:diguanylate cyclase (GGDEF)-like protein